MVSTKFVNTITKASIPDEVRLIKSFGALAARSFYTVEGRSELELGYLPKAGEEVGDHGFIWVSTLQAALRKAAKPKKKKKIVKVSSASAGEEEKSTSTESEEAEKPAPDKGKAMAKGKSNDKPKAKPSSATTSAKAPVVKGSLKSPSSDAGPSGPTEEEEADYASLRWQISHLELDRSQEQLALSREFPSSVGVGRMAARLNMETAEDAAKANWLLLSPTSRRMLCMTVNAWKALLRSMGAPETARLTEDPACAGSYVFVDKSSFLAAAS